MQPKLLLKYFMQRIVYSDDPFTSEVEPAIPFFLGLQIQNIGMLIHSLRTALASI